MDETIYLAHHGILGQKWGKKNGPPYPLNETQKSYKEKKNESVKSKLASNDVYTYTSNLAFAISSVGSMIGLATGNALIAKGAGYVSSAMVASAAALMTPRIIKDGQDFVKNLNVNKYTNKSSNIPKEATNEKSKIKENSLIKIVNDAKAASTNSINENRARTKAEDQKIDKYVDKVFTQIEKKSGSWYNGTYVTKNFKEALDVLDKKDTMENRMNLAGVVLKDLGYEDTKIAREAIYDSIFWD